MIIGLTGGIGSGKSAAAACFSELGVPVIDTDRIAHELTAAGQPVLQEIAGIFGAEILNPDGTLNRAALRARVFAHPEERHQLEAILHPRIRERVTALVAQHAGSPYQIVVVPLLFEANGYVELIDRSLIIDCDESLQIARTMQRSNLSEQEVLAIMNAQISRAQRLARADDIITNDGNLDDLREKIKEQHQKYINTCTVSESIS
jgi:dephospho-CoA kinase